MSEVTVGVPITLKDPDAFLLVKESLTRIGVASTKNKTLYQTAHILHARGKYYICHFKELFLLDGKDSTIDDDDYDRRNTIVKLLVSWGLVTLVDGDIELISAPVSSVKILPFKEKDDWNLVAKYQLGKKQF